MESCSKTIGTWVGPDPRSTETFSCQALWVNIYICNKKPSKFRPLHPCLPPVFFILQEYPGKVSSLWRSIFVVLAQIEHHKKNPVRFCSRIESGWRCHHRACKKQRSWLCQIQSAFCDQHSVSKLHPSLPWNVTRWPNSCYTTAWAE